MSRYTFDSGKFVIEQFHEGKPFASFLPGLAGLKGIPMWTFYVNRGQGISSFGVRDKNSPIMEFSPANISYKNVTSTGFRTFIKLKGAAEIYEPFQSARPDPAAKRIMTILPNGLTIEESHAGHGLKTTVHYFNLPGMIMPRWSARWRFRIPAGLSLSWNCWTVCRRCFHSG